MIPISLLVEIRKKRGRASLWLSHFRGLGIVSREKQQLDVEIQLLIRGQLC
jgi:hypothetical protein